MLCRGEDGSLFSYDCELPFSQYADLDGNFDQNPTVSVHPCVTSLDVAMDEGGQLMVKAGVLGQYLVSEQTVVTVAEDAYSPRRQVTPLTEQLQLPAILDQTTQNIRAEQSIPTDASQPVDVTFLPQMGQPERTESGVRIPLQGQFQMLYYDPEGELRSTQTTWEGMWSQNAAGDARVWTWLSAEGKPEIGAGNLRGNMIVNGITTAGQGISMVTGLELGEVEKPNSDRPSLILCKKGNRRLWDVAKDSGSTVQTILQANGLTEETDEDRVLLIPVL